MTAADPVANAADALRIGDGAQAIQLLLAAPQPLRVQGEWTLAAAYRAMGDEAGEAAALKRILTVAPRDIGTLLALADLAARQGDQRAQLAYIQTALAQAQVTPPPPSAAPLLQQARATAVELQQALTAHLETTIAALGLNDAAASPALRHAVALLRGESELFLQQPSMFYYPGLPQRPWYERNEFAWIGAFEDQASALREELTTVMATPGTFAPYVERPGNRPPPNNHLLDDPAWGASYLWRAGALVEGIADRAPRTIAALTSAPQPVVPGRAPMALWSRLTPGAHIMPHHGLLNTRLICHLPLIAPEGCALRVGHETREWRFGEMLIFDDSFEHEAWNRGAGDRVVLLFEIWRPEIPTAERDLLAQLFAAIDTVDAAGANG